MTVEQAIKILEYRNTWGNVPVIYGNDADDIIELLEQLKQ